MKAAVCYEFGKPLVLEEVSLEPPGPGEVKVRIAATAICHSDIHDIKGHFGDASVLPFVPGHESAGYVEEVGDNVTSVKVGDAVIVSLLSSCQNCLSCLAGLPHLCEARTSFDGDKHVRNKDGKRLIQKAKVGGFAEYCVVEESQLITITDEIPIESAALLACGVITGFGAVVNRAKVKPFSSVVVIGAGGVGLNSIQGALISGANPIIAVDIWDEKLKTARTFGASDTINASHVDPVDAVMQMTEGKGVDYVFTTVGNAKAVRQGLSMLGRRGTLVIVGIPPASEKMDFLPSELNPWEKTIMGCFMGSTSLKTDIPNLIKLYKAGRLKVDELITALYPLEQINEAMELVQRGEALRNIIVFK